MTVRPHTTERQPWLKWSVGLCLSVAAVFVGAAQTPAPAGQLPPPAAPGASRAGGAAQAAAAQPRIKALLVSGGSAHDYTGQDKIMMDTIRRALPVDWMVAYQNGTAGKIPLYSDPNWYKGYDIIVHNECYPDVADEAYIRQITAAHKAGIPGIVIHCALHSYRAAKVDDWREFLGATSFRHPEEDAPITVKMIAQTDPIIKGLAPEWTTPIDELYIIEKFWPGAKALATAVSPEPDHAEFAVIWTNDYHGTRVFGTSLGHAQTWNEPIFQEVLTRGFQWALKREVTGLPPVQPGRGARGGGRGGDSPGQ